MRIHRILLALMICSCGCSNVELTGPHEEYLAPKVEGCVKDAVTLAPIRGASVTRCPGDNRYQKVDALNAKAGQMLAAEPPAVTDKEGRFALRSVKSGNLLFSYGSMSTVNVVVESPGYHPLWTNFDSWATNVVVDGKTPIFKAGDLFLEPKKKR